MTLYSLNKHHYFFLSYTFPSRSWLSHTYILVIDSDTVKTNFSFFKSVWSWVLLWTPIVTGSNPVIKCNKILSCFIWGTLMWQVKLLHDVPLTEEWC